MLAVNSGTRREPPAADRDAVIAHGQRRERRMQDRRHRQAPILGLVALDGEGRSTDELAEKVLAYVLRAAEAGLTSLAGSGHPRIAFLRSVQASAESLLAR